MSKLEIKEKRLYGDWKIIKEKIKRTIDKGERKRAKGKRKEKVGGMRSAREKRER